MGLGRRERITLFTCSNSIWDCMNTFEGPVLEKPSNFPSACPLFFFHRPVHREIFRTGRKNDGQAERTHKIKALDFAFCKALGFGVWPLHLRRKIFMAVRVRRQQQQPPHVKHGNVER
ncbi:hypothetical protein ACFE04_011126 [Oxalis oulophora]